METSIVGPVPSYTTDHKLYKVFECRSDVSAIPPPYKRDVVLHIRLSEDAIWRINPQFMRGSQYCDISDTSKKGNVTGCAFRGIPSLANQTMTACTEVPIGHPLAYNKLESPTNAPSGTILTQTHEYTCLPNVGKLKVVTIFSAGWIPFVVTCTMEIATATVGGCEGKHVRLF